MQERIWLLKVFKKTEPDNDPIPFMQVVEAIGLVAIRYMGTLGISDKEIRLLACDLAEMVLPLFEAKYPEEDFPHRAIEAARLHANGEISDYQLGVVMGESKAALGAIDVGANSLAHAAWAAANSAIDTTQLDTGCAVACATGDAAYAANAAWGADGRKRQLEIFRRWFERVQK